MAEKATEILHVRVTPRLMQRLRALADVGRLTVSTVVQLALEAQCRPDARPAHVIAELRAMADRRGL